ncbi:MAG TPA: ammonia-forming cytochrome c nitrite reductase subunit c552 [Armatimonadota bacterium]|nr:ammonia-forming cytochrome c nitrite reductase subunit c552 [Armatimonadota bacterium]
MSRLRTATSHVANGVLLYAVALGIVAVAALSLAGCGGGGGATALAPGASAWAQASTAAYVGMAKCQDCHAGTYAEYMQTTKGNNPATRHTLAANCANCHVTGPERLPFNADGSIDPAAVPAHLNGIGCESCHGPGGLHVKSLKAADITRKPPSAQTCAACHGGRPYNNLAGPEELITADYPELKNAGANTTIRGPHHTGAAFVYGRNGYNIPKAMPGPHATLPNGCLDCHTPEKNPATNKVFHGRYDANTTAWSKPNLDTSRTNCASCHGGRSAAFMQAGVVEKMKQIGGTDAADPATFDTNGKAADGLLQQYFVNKNLAAIYAKAAGDRTPADVAMLNNYTGAMWNFKYIYGDHSLGVHNPGFTKKLLQDCEAMLK